MAFGSDDYGRVWVENEPRFANKKPKFSTGTQPHAYIPDRGWKPIQLTQGVNHILVKLENAGGTTGFSVIFSVDPNFKPSSTKDRNGE